MKSPRQRTISVEEVHYLEWHDGLVRGILDTPNGPSLVALVAWDPDTRRRAYILLGLNSDDSERLKQFAGLASGDAGKLHARWAAMQAEFERVLQRCKSSFAMTRTEPAK